MIKKIILWVLAIFLAIAAMVYQRSTGPTYEYKGYLEHAGEKHKYELLRSQETTEGAKIELPNIEATNYKAVLHYKRYQTKDAVTSIEFQLDESKKFIAQLPVQPAAGKMKYFITGTIDGKEFNIPEEGADKIVLRYKDPVADAILIPHVLMMIIVIIFGIRTGAE